MTPAPKIGLLPFYLELYDEHWLYFTGAPRSHAWYVGTQGKKIEARIGQMQHNEFGRIGIARWPKFRLFGFQADPQGELEIDLGEITEPMELALNYTTETGGGIRVKLKATEPSGSGAIFIYEDVVGRGEQEAVTLTGDSTGQTVAWKNGTIIAPVPGKHIIAQLALECATVYAYELRPTGRNG